MKKYWAIFQTQVVNSLVQTLSVDQAVVYNDATVEFSLTVSNVPLPGAVPVNFDIYFSPPGPSGAKGAYGTEVKP